MGVVFLLNVLAINSVQAQGSFTTASLEGTYSYINNTGHVGSFGLIIFDGNGKLTTTIKVNAPGEKGGRKVFAMTGTGTYSVEANGTGVAKINFKGDREVEDSFDFVITQIEKDGKGGNALATEIFAVKHTGGLKGQLVTPIWKRR